MVLRRVGSVLEAELGNDPAAKEPYTTLPWRLRQRQGLTQTAGIPFSFVSADELCFAQTEFQACLAARTPTVGSAENFAAIANAIEKLKADNLLPEDAQVRTEAAMPGIQGRDTLSKCQGLSDGEQPQTARRCRGGRHGCAGRPGGWSDGDFFGFDRRDRGASVLTDIPDEVFDSEGKLVQLEAANYRVDLVRVEESKNRWLAEFVQAGGQKAFYLYAVEVYTRRPGEPGRRDLSCKRLDLSEFGREALLGTYYYSPCQKSKDTGIVCNNPQNRRRRCITDGTRAGAMRSGTEHERVDAAPG